MEEEIKEELNTPDEVKTSAQSGEMIEVDQTVQDAEIAEIKKELEAAQQESREAIEYNKFGLLMDLSLQITVELGRKEMQFGEILKLGKGSIIELNKLAEEPVDIYVNQSKIAQGEVVVIDERFGVKITKLVGPSERIKNLA